MKSLLLILALLVCSISLHAQFINDGGTIIISESSTLNIQNLDVTNMNSGEIVNYGMLIIEGQFTNELGSTFESSENAITEMGEGGVMILKTPKNNLKRSEPLKPKKEKKSVELSTQEIKK